MTLTGVLIIFAAVFALAFRFLSKRNRVQPIHVPPPSPKVEELTKLIKHDQEVIDATSKDIIELSKMDDAQFAEEMNKKNGLKL